MQEKQTRWFFLSKRQHAHWLSHRRVIDYLTKKCGTLVNSLTLHQSAFNWVGSYIIRYQRQTRHPSQRSRQQPPSADYPWSHNIPSLSNWYHWSKLSPPFCLSVCLSVCQCRSIAAVTCCCFSPSPSPPTFIPSIAEDQCSAPSHSHSLPQYIT